MDNRRLVLERKLACGIEEVPVCAIQNSPLRLIGANGAKFYEANVNVWIEDSEDGADVAYLNTGKHGAGATLRPLYLLIDGVWRNATTGEAAPESIALPMSGSRA